MKGCGQYAVKRGGGGRSYRIAKRFLIYYKLYKNLKYLAENLAAKVTTHSTLKWEIPLSLKHQVFPQKYGKGKIKMANILAFYLFWENIENSWQMRESGISHFKQLHLALIQFQCSYTCILVLIV